MDKWRTVGGRRILIKDGQSLEDAMRASGKFKNPKAKESSAEDKDCLTPVEEIRLPKNEYAHIMSEIATNLTKEQTSKRIFSKAIGDYIYTIENNGFGAFKIIGKTPIGSEKYGEDHDESER